MFLMMNKQFKDVFRYYIYEKIFEINPEVIFTYSTGKNVALNKINDELAESALIEVPLSEYTNQISNCSV